MKYNREEALRYFGTTKDDVRAGSLVDLAYLKVRNEVKAKSTYMRVACEINDSTVLIDGREKFNSKDLATHLKGCKEVFLFAATLGAGVDKVLRQLTVTDLAEAAAVQAVSAALIESYCDEICCELERSLPEGESLTNRFSPGYSDWDLLEQKTLTNLLDTSKKIGLTLTDSCMMAPIKSVTAVIGIRQGKTEKNINKCDECTNGNCEYRKTN